MKTLYTGTSGYSYQHWKGLFYPEGLGQAKLLSYYAQHYNTVEINATFYRTFGRHVFERWSASTPENFTFAIKGPKSITRDKRLQDVNEELAIFFEGAAGLGDKLAVILWQMPPSFKLDPETLEVLAKFLAKLPSDYRHAFEFRHVSWDHPSALELLQRYTIGWVIADSSRYFGSQQIPADFSYIRYHGPTKLYASEYSEEDLDAWTETIHSILTTKDVFCFFNNDFGGYALRDCKRLAAKLDLKDPTTKSPHALANPQP
jgi:uncharacterized protein YecE (DUF72 family)